MNNVMNLITRFLPLDLFIILNAVKYSRHFFTNKSGKMRNFIAILFVELTFLFNPFMVNAQFNQFTFIKGNTTDFSMGSYGTQGVASVSNNPGKRSLATSWNYNGKMYLFGGAGSSSQINSNSWLNDLWEYDATNKNWRWLKGSNLNDALATTGTQGVAGANNTPGARESGASWILNSKLYLFGGFGARLSPFTLFHLNDLWEYDPTTNNWRWLSGSPNSDNPSPVYGIQGIFDPSNNPGGRERSLIWTYNGKLYLFGGLINNLFKNDLWEYDPSINQWRWVSGSSGTNVAGIFGIQGVAAITNLPGGRQGAGVGVVHDFALPSAPELVKVLPDTVHLTRAFWLIRHADDARADRLNRFASRLADGIRREVQRLEALS